MLLLLLLLSRGMDIPLEHVLYADTDRKTNTRYMNSSNLVLAGTSMQRRTGCSTIEHYTVYYIHKNYVTTS